MASNVKPDDVAQRTFKITRRPPDGLAYAISVAEKYRLTYRQLNERLQPMKAFLLHRDRDFDLKRGAPPNEDDLMRDLELDTLLRAMAVKDELVLKVAKAALMAATSNDVATIEYRQAVLRDCLSNPEIVRQLYALTEEAFQHMKKIWTTFREYPSGSLEDSIERMRDFHKCPEENSQAG